MELGMFPLDLRWVLICRTGKKDHGIREVGIQLQPLQTFCTVYFYFELFVFRYHDKEYAHSHLLNWPCRIYTLTTRSGTVGLADFPRRYLVTYACFYHHAWLAFLLWQSHRVPPCLSGRQLPNNNKIRSLWPCPSR